MTSRHISRRDARIRADVLGESLVPALRVEALVIGSAILTGLGTWVFSKLEAALFVVKLGPVVAAGPRDSLDVRGSEVRVGGGAWRSLRCPPRAGVVMAARPCRTSRNSPDRTPNNSPPGLVRFFYPFGPPFSSLPPCPGRRLGR
jgi:hypothetical protein